MGLFSWLTRKKQEFSPLTPPKYVKLLISIQSRRYDVGFIRKTVYIRNTYSSFIQDEDLRQAMVSLMWRTNNKDMDKFYFEPNYIYDCSDHIRRIAVECHIPTDNELLLYCQDDA